MNKEHSSRFDKIPLILGQINHTAMGSFIVVGACSYCNPQDEHLLEVLCFDHQRNHWVIWTYNNGSKCYFHGRYFQADAVKAYEEFGTTLAKKGVLVDVRA